MDHPPLDALGPPFSDLARYPKAHDVLDAMWLLEDLAEEAESAGQHDEAGRRHRIAQAAREEYQHRCAGAGAHGG
jgi:hypothetical protein